MNYRLLLLVVFELILENSLITCDIDSDIKDYYNSDTLNSFNNQWEIIRKPFENALKVALIENFGRKSMNTIERKTNDALDISEGFYLYDNVVHMIFHGLRLEGMPHIKNPEIYFPLAYNVLHLQGMLSKMIIETKYTLMRNNSDVLFAGTNFDPNSNSPFALQQVQDIGSLAILVEDCLLNGFVITKLVGHTIVLGHDTFEISDCKFTIEISAEGLGAPPVIAPYFSLEQRSILESLMSKPIREELRSKLQAALFSYVNTTIFNDLVTFRKNQQLIFKETLKYVIEFIRNSNKEKMETDKAAFDLEPLEIVWNATINGVSQVRSIKLKDIVIDGFDSAYAPRTGGPYKLHTVGIAEAQRYNTLKVQGKMFFEHHSQTEHDFSLELIDVTININKDVGQKQFYADSKAVWRDTVFSITNVENASERITAEAIANGYLINEIHKLFTSKLSKLKNVKTLKEIENLGLERLSDISGNNELELEADRSAGKKGSEKLIGLGDVNDDVSGNNPEAQRVVQDSLPVPDDKDSEEDPDIDPRTVNQDSDVQESNDEEGRRKRKQKRKKHKKHSKRNQHKYGRRKKGYKQKKKAHSH